MKTSLISLFAMTSVAALINVSPAFAGTGHDHGPKYGGVVREVRNVTYELVAKPDTLTLHVSDHGKSVATQGATAEAVIYGSSDKSAVRLKPEGENRMVAKGAFKVGVGVRVVLTTTLPGKTPAKATFNLK